MEKYNFDSNEFIECLDRISGFALKVECGSLDFKCEDCEFSCDIFGNIKCFFLLVREYEKKYKGVDL